MSEQATGDRMGVVVNGRFIDQRVTGQQRYSHELVNRLKPQVKLITPGRPLSGPRGHLWEQSVLPFRIGKNLLWSPSATGPLAVGRQVVTIHDAIPLDHPQWFTWQFARWYRTLLPRLMRRVRHILTVSQYSRSRLLEHVAIPEDKITAIPLGVDPRFAPADAAVVQSLRARLQLPERYVLMVASLDPRKNLIRLLQAWERVEDKLDGAELVVAGGAGKQFMATALDRLPRRVRLTGYVDDADLPALYSGACAFVFPSICEGFGLPPLEAMACGTPVITSNVSSLPEVVGDSALLVDPLDIDAIAEGIRRVITDESLAESLRCRGRAQAEPFTWQRTADATWTVLTNVLKQECGIRSTCEAPS